MLSPTDTTQTNISNTSTLQPMGFSEILDTIFSLYRKHFPLFLGIVAVDFCGNLVVYFFSAFSPKFPVEKLGNRSCWHAVWPCKHGWDNRCDGYNLFR